MSAATDLAVWFTTPVQVERYLGTGATGDVFSAATTELAMLDGNQKLIRTPDGGQVMASGFLYMAASVTYVPVGSRVTLPAPETRRTIVLTSALNQTGLDTPDHLALALE